MRRARLAAAQTEVRAGDKEYNLSRIEALAEQAGDQHVDLVCFPEMALTGSTHGQVDLAEPIPGPATARLSATARRHHLWMVVGMLEADPDGGRPRNSAVVLDPEGEVRAVYRKVFLYLGERDSCEPGREPCLVDLPFGRVAVTICYDYIFPSYIAGLVDRGAEVILHATAWVNTRTCTELRYNTGAYRAVGIARAAENTVWVVSANQYGRYDAAGELWGLGQSAIIAPWAEILAEVVAGEGLAVAEVDLDAVQVWRERAAPYLEDRRYIDPWAG